MHLPAQIVDGDHAPIARTDRPGEETVHPVKQDRMAPLHAAEARPLIEPELPQGAPQGGCGYVGSADRHELAHTGKGEAQGRPADRREPNRAAPRERAEQLLHVHLDPGARPREVSHVDGDLELAGGRWRARHRTTRSRTRSVSAAHRLQRNASAPLPPASMRRARSAVSSSTRRCRRRCCRPTRDRPAPPLLGELLGAIPVRRDHRAAGGHRLQHRQAARLEQRRQEQRVGERVDARQLVLLDAIPVAAPTR